MGYLYKYNDFLVRLIRLSLEGRQQDTVTFIKKSIKNFRESHPELSAVLKSEIDIYQNSLKSNTKKVENTPIPIDIDSKLNLLQKESIKFDSEPVWPKRVSEELNMIVKEKKIENKLIKEGLLPTKTLLFVGSPGVGKTMAAKWLSFTLGVPIVTLDLAAVMSSYLGKTGNNIKAVLEYAQKNPCILLLDEFDSLAKRRSDESELGELKRLVNVLLQEIDKWSNNSLLIAATNHSELLDPAVWRRFDKIIEFPKPSTNEISYTIQKLLEKNKFNCKDIIIDILSVLMEGNSYSDITKEINNLRKYSIVQEISLIEVLENFIFNSSSNLDKKEKINISLKLLRAGYSQRQTSEIFGISRDTIRKYSNEE